MYLFILWCAILSIVSTNVLRPVVTFPEPERSAIGKEIMQCIHDTGISTDVLKVVRDGKYLEDRQFQEFIYCAHKKTGYATDDGHLLVDKALKLFPKGVGVEEVFNKCNEENGSDAVETTYKYFKCFQNNSPVRMQVS